MTDVRADQEDAEALVGEAGTAVGAAVGPQPTHLPVPRTARWGACAAALLVIAAGTATVLSVHHKHSVQADEASRRQVLAELRTRLPAALGYDYRHLDRDISQATSGLTPRFASDYRKLFETTIVPTATKYRGVVTAEVVAIEPVVERGNQRVVGVERQVLGNGKCWHRRAPRVSRPRCGCGSIRCCSTVRGRVSCATGRC